MVWLSYGEKIEDMFIRFVRMYERDGRADGHIASRGKKKRLALADAEMRIIR